MRTGLSAQRGVCAGGAAGVQQDVQVRGRGRIDASVGIGDAQRVVFSAAHPVEGEQLHAGYAAVQRKPGNGGDIFYGIVEAGNDRRSDDGVRAGRSDAAQMLRDAGKLSADGGGPVRIGGFQIVIAAVQQRKQRIQRGGGGAAGGIEQNRNSGGAAAAV